MNMRKVAFETRAFEELEDWVKTDKKILQKIFTLIKDAQKNPFSGIGKPEPLKHELQGY